MTRLEKLAKRVKSCQGYPEADIHKLCLAAPELLLFHEKVIAYAWISFGKGGEWGDVGDGQLIAAFREWLNEDMAKIGDAA